jgi:hypothetical protein
MAFGNAELKVMINSACEPKIFEGVFLTKFAVSHPCFPFAIGDNIEVAISSLRIE